MAKIFKTNDQEKALKEIVDSLKIIGSINTIMEDEDIRDLKIRIAGTIEAGTINELIPMPFSVISSSLKDYRKRLIKEVLDKSKTYSIRLEDDEKEILGIKIRKDEDAKAGEEEPKTHFVTNQQPISNYEREADLYEPSMHS